MVEFGLVGVGGGEGAHRAGEGVVVSEVAGDGGAVAGSGVGARERPGAQLAVSAQVRPDMASTAADPFQSRSWRT